LPFLVSQLNTRIIIHHYQAACVFYYPSGISPFLTHFIDSTSNNNNTKDVLGHREEMSATRLTIREALAVAQERQARIEALLEKIKGRGAAPSAIHDDESESDDGDGDGGLQATLDEMKGDVASCSELRAMYETDLAWMRQQLATIGVSV
jgi:hypothetical protein